MGIILYEDGKIQVNEIKNNQTYAIGIRDGCNSKYAYYLLMTEDLNKFASGPEEKFTQRLHGFNQKIFVKLKDCSLLARDVQTALLSASEYKKEDIEKKVQNH